MGGLRGLGAAIGRRITPVRPDLADKGAKTAPLRLLIFCERLAASQHVHLLRPLRRLRGEGACALAVVSEMALPKLKHKERALDHLWKTWRPNAVIMSRFAGPQTAAILAHAKAANTPVIAHLDDFLFGIPEDLGPDKLHQHSRPARIEALRQVFAAADVQFISTTPLAEKIATLGFSSPVYVPRAQSGADADEFAPVREGVSDTVVVGYQGSQNHKLDLKLIVPALAKVLEARPNVRFELFGTIAKPAELERFGDRVTRRQALGDYDAFLGQLKRLGWDIGLAPLRDTEFNAFRTYTKWVEYALAGVPTLASDTPAVSRRLRRRGWAAGRRRLDRAPCSTWSTTRRAGAPSQPPPRRR